MEIRTEEIMQIILSDSGGFSYTIKEVEITNILGNAVAVLDEYFVTNSAGGNYKLYKTKEGNWYDMPDANMSVNQRKLMFLKVAIENK
jgi:hypothetical protein